MASQQLWQKGGDEGQRRGESYLCREIRRINRSRQRIYDEEVVKVLKRIWYIMDFPWGKRLAPCFPWMVPKLEH